MDDVVEISTRHVEPVPPFLPSLFGSALRAPYSAHATRATSRARDVPRRMPSLATTGKPGSFEAPVAIDDGGLAGGSAPPSCTSDTNTWMDGLKGAGMDAPTPRYVDPHRKAIKQSSSAQKSIHTARLGVFALRRGVSTRRGRIRDAP